MSKDIVLPIDGQNHLALIQLAHGKELFALIQHSRSSLRQWLPWVEFVQELSELMQLISYYRHKFANNGALTTTIFHRQQVAGIIGLNYVNWASRSATIGYWLGQNFRGKGLMLQACQRLVDYAFTEMQLHRIQILCASGNVASQRIPEKLNFRREGLLREGEWLIDHYVDLYSYGMLSKNWQALPAGFNNSEFF